MFNNYDYFKMHSYVLKDYKIIFVFLGFAVTLSIVFLSFSYFLRNQTPDLEKLSSYECGFEPYEDSKHIFDLRFYLLAVLFIIFDIEIVFLIPWV